MRDLSFDEIESVSGGFEFTGEGIAAGVGTFVGGLGGSYFGLAALGLAAGPGAAVAGAALFAVGAYSLYRTIDGIID
jgi:hypothetical protein